MAGSACTASASARRAWGSVAPFIAVSTGSSAACAWASVSLVGDSACTAWASARQGLGIGRVLHRRQHRLERRLRLGVGELGRQRLHGLGERPAGPWGLVVSFIAVSTGSSAAWAWASVNSGRDRLHGLSERARGHRNRIVPFIAVSTVIERRLRLVRLEAA